MLVMGSPFGTVDGRTLPWRGIQPHRQTYLSGTADNLVLNGEQGSAGPAGNADLAVDVLGMVLCGAPGDHQARGNLRIAVPGCDEFQDLNLPIAQTCGVGAPRLPTPVACLGKDRADRVVVELASVGLSQDTLGGLFKGHRGAIGARLQHRSDGIGHRE
jgi:hypothetical protein